MKAEKILFPTDFSHTGDEALALATSLARDTGATLLIVHVEEPPVAYQGGYYGVANPTANELQEMLHQVVPSDPDVAYSHHLIAGDPAPAITRLAESENVDLIVLGTHGRGGLKRLIMGSVAEKVVRTSPCPVLTYKQPSEKAAEAQ